jgi:hypothetical protein
MKSKISKKLIALGLLAFLVVVLAGCLPKKVANVGTSEGDSAEEVFSGTFAELMKLGGSIKCTFAVDTEAGKSSGTVYVSGKQTRNDFEVTTNEGNFESHFVSDGEWAYTWGSQMPNGVKMRLSDFEGETANTSDATVPEYQGAVNMQDKFDYKCSPWIVDVSKFELPSDVTFVDMTQTLQNLQDQLEDMDISDFEGMKENLGL